MPGPPLSRDDAVARIHDVFRERGFDAATLAAIAEATGLAKRNLQNYFPGGKTEMALAVLERIDGWMKENALEPLRADGSPTARLRAMLSAVETYYAAGGNASVLAHFALGSGREKLKKPMKTLFHAWIDALRALAIEAGIGRAEALQRAEDAVSRLEGALVVAAGMGDAEFFARAVRRIEREFLN